MSANNPSITASSIIADVENRLGTPNISTTTYIPWVSYGYSKTWAALNGVGQEAREELFGAYIAVSLTNGLGEYTLSTIIPRFSSFIKAEIQYGGNGDIRVPIGKIRSLANWQNMGNVSTSYRSKSDPILYRYKNTLGIIPTPPATDTIVPTLYVWYVQKPFQITDGADIIDLEYRYIYPLVNYVQAKAIQTEHEDYATSLQIENLFEKELNDIAETVASEYNENEGESIETSSSSSIYDNPLGSW